MYKIVFLADSVRLLRILFCKKEELEKVEAAGWAKVKITGDKGRYHGGLVGKGGGSKRISKHSKKDYNNISNSDNNSNNKK